MEISSQIANPVVLSLSEEEIKRVLNTPIDWKASVSDGILSPAVIDILSKFDLGEFKSNPKAWFGAIFEGLNKISQTEYLRYLLTILETALEDDKDYSTLMIELGASEQSGVSFQTLYSFLDRNDLYIQARAAAILCIVLRNSSSPPSAILDPFLHHIRNVLKKTDNDNSLTLCLHALGQLLRNLKIRYLFIKSSGLEYLVPLLTAKSQNLQILYEALYCLWLCSFSSQYVPNLRESSLLYDSMTSSSSLPASSSSSAVYDISDNSKSNVNPLLSGHLLLMPALVQILKFHTKDKIIRMSLAIIRNLLSGKGVESESDATSAMASSMAGQQLIEAGCVKALHILLSKQWRDDELKNDLQWVADTLNKKEDQMCSMEAYAAELKSGRLTWSPPHVSEKFWKENYSRFDSENFQMVRDLATLLFSQDPVTLAVVCRDIGNFAVFHPRGRALIESYNIKSRILELMSAEDQTVQREALLCIQKILTQKWGVLQSMGSSFASSPVPSSSPAVGSASSSSASSSAHSASGAMKNPLASPSPV
ncbi:putative vacuolar proton pump subunit H [Monocercomonoides exilis]|uniref:putative vacuolar proton pump subunit H n=1 Tax=Monocercomonoides exilis TaxID=2049356 RepID=UPI003559E0DA|nr:putative vacuolar proton pump subunit H [Monocercomonoides exilis]|eukprot:MONOS_8927.1-p1 / transcript=MONOS_8927.1 / gene=MONOS_8927 / organism=Monocercomonoides_exilis_PA203 / gene_product=vacuolar proton pump subunit H / transcript_product=vacuolar proton pump subunit H / location=Mono_scaffold00351:42853-44808(+) / protein_length=536 / sequence_SO=supercontig / SO=protein_coding / is_pseudo=false